VAVSVTPEQVRELRDRTGAGVMDCKRALEDAGGEMEKAIELLRERGMARAAKREARRAAEGHVSHYIHLGGKIGALAEVNCETDFVARTPEFLKFAHEVAMQVASMDPDYVRREDVPSEVIEKENEIYRTQAEQEGKPEKVRDKIAEGRLEKFFNDTCLMEQPYIRDPEKTIEDLRKELAGQVGENVVVRRFVRFQVGQ
jgi:elongation factor Ts